MSMLSSRVPATLLLLACSLAGCGGGGGGSAPAPSPAPAPAPSPAPPAPPANAAPVMPAATFNGTEEQDLIGQLAATDANGDPITFTVTTAPSRGSMAAFGANGAFTYRPNANVFGSDTFVVTASDGRGGSVSATMTLNIANVDDPLLAANDRVELAYAGTLTLDVLANDSHDDAAVSIIEPALVGTATVNANGTVSISGMPADFRGLTRFRYRLTEPAGGTSDAVANVFVGSAPFRAILRMNGADSHTFDIGVTDFTGEPRLVNLNEPGPANARNVSMRASSNGDVVAWYRQIRTDPDDSGRICSVRTAPGHTPQCFEIPDHLRLGNTRPNQSGLVYDISPDGRWIAAVLERDDQVPAASLYLIDTDAPTQANLVAEASEHAIRPAFSSDSRYLYYNGAVTLSNDGFGIYRVALGTAQAPLLMTRFEFGSIVDGFAVSSDGARLVFQRYGTDVGVWWVDTAVPGQEHRLSHAFGGNEWLQRQQTTPVYVNAAATTVAYVMWHLDNARDIWMADVSATSPAPRLVASVPGVSTSPSLSPMVRPDGGAVLYNWGTGATSNTTMSYEASKTPGPPQPLAQGLWGSYAFDGNYLLNLNIVYANPAISWVSNYTVLARPQVGGAATQAGSPGQQAVTAGGDLHRPALIIGESPDGSSPIRPQLVNYAAPDRPLSLTSEAFSGYREDGSMYFVVDGE